MRILKQSGHYSVVEYGTGILKYILEYSDSKIMNEVASSYNKEEIYKKFVDMINQTKN